MDKKIRTRFAPSPTGYLHVGGLRTALYDYLFAKKMGGSFILRIEDTDQTREVKGAIENIVSTLSWAGLSYDEGPGKPGICDTYIQSQRLPIYKKYAEQLVAQGDAYYCFCTQGRLEELKNQQTDMIGYDRHCRNLSKEEVEKKLASGTPYVIRMKVPLEGEITIKDLIRGEVTIDFKAVDDQVLLKSDGFPTYHLAVVVDDYQMEISHVFRGEEWLPSTPKHLLLYKYFGWPVPEFAHLPLLLNPDRSKLSKRQGDVAVEDYMQKGYLPQALINFIALLGWNPGEGDEREIFSLQELVNEFSIERVGKSGAIFNIEKLQWLNGVYIRQMSAQDIKIYIDKNLGFDFKKSFANFNDIQIIRLMELYKDRVKTLRELIDCIHLIHAGPAGNYDKVAIAQWLTVETKGYIQELIKILEDQQDFAHDNLALCVKALAKDLGIKLVAIAQPIRIAITGTSASPGVFELLEVIGKKESINRLKAFLVNL